MAHARWTFISRFYVYVTLLLLSNGIQWLAYIIHGGNEWLKAFVVYLFMTGIGSYLMHVIPAIVAYHIRRAMDNRREARSRVMTGARSL